MLLAGWRVLATALAPAVRLHLRRRARQGKEVPDRLPERRGIEATPRPPGKLLWLHAASVGEVASILPVLAALHHRAPALHILLTTGTVTSMRLLHQRLPALGLPALGLPALGLPALGLPALGLASVQHRFLPWDVPAWASRFLRHWRPDAAAFVESELWPNLLRQAHALRIPLMLVNARLSARSAARWRQAPRSARQVLSLFDRIQAQGDADAERLRALGARHVSAPGDLKFAAPALPADPAELARLRGVLGPSPVWLAASTHAGEETIAAEAHQRLLPGHPGLVTIIAPRHPERGAALAEAWGAPRRSLRQDPQPGQVWMADTLGELGLLFRLAGLAFVGKSLAGRGGQNPLEPARLGCAVAAGPHMGNFEAATAALTEAGALTRVHDTESLAFWVDAMLRDPRLRADMGRAGQDAASRHEGLPDQIAAALLELMR